MPRPGLRQLCLSEATRRLMGCVFRLARPQSESVECGEKREISLSFRNDCHFEPVSVDGGWLGALAFGKIDGHNSARTISRTNRMSNTPRHDTALRPIRPSSISERRTMD